MSILYSKFQILGGLPPYDNSAMRKDIQPAAATTLTEGNVVKVGNSAGTEVASLLTSAHLHAAQPPDVPWLVIEGNDQGDGAMANKCTAVKLYTGLIFQIETTESFTIGDLCQSVAGVIKPLTGDNQQAIGQVIGVNSAANTVVIAS